MTGIKSGSGPAGMISERTCSKMQLEPEPLGQPAGIADGLLGVGAEIGRGEDGLISIT